MFVSRKISLLGSAIVWSVLIGILITFAASKFIVLVDRVDTSQQIVTIAQNIDNSLINMAAGERAFILTGDTDYLKPYEEYYLTLKSLTDQLRQLSSQQDGEYQLDINALAALDDQKVISVSDLIAFRKKVGLDTAAKMFTEANSEVSQDELHAEVLSIQTEQIGVVNRLTAQARNYAEIIIGSIAWLFLCLIVDIIIFNRYYKKMQSLI